MKSNVKVLFCTLILLSLTICFSVLSFAAGEIGGEELSDVQNQTASYQETVSETTTEEEGSFVVYIPTIPAATTTESVYEIAAREAERKMSIIESEYLIADSERQVVIKGFDLSIRVECLCSVKGDIPLQLYNKTTGVTYHISLSPKNNYYHYKEYPKGDYELTDSSPNEHAYTVETQSFSLGKYEHISLLVFVYDDIEEYKKAKEPQAAVVSNYYAHTVPISSDTETVIESTTNVVKEEKEKMPTYLFLLYVFIALFFAAAFVLKNAKVKCDDNNDNDEHQPNNNQAM